MAIIRMTLAVKIESEEGEEGEGLSTGAVLVSTCCQWMMVGKHSPEYDEYPSMQIGEHDASK